MELSPTSRGELYLLACGKNPLALGVELETLVSRLFPGCRADAIREYSYLDGTIRIHLAFLRSDFPGGAICFSSSLRKLPPYGLELYESFYLPFVETSLKRLENIYMSYNSGVPLEEAIALELGSITGKPEIPGMPVSDSTAGPLSTNATTQQTDASTGQLERIESLKSWLVSLNELADKIARAYDQEKVLLERQ